MALRQATDGYETRQRLLLRAVLHPAQDVARAVGEHRVEADELAAQQNVDDIAWQKRFDERPGGVGFGGIRGHGEAWTVAHGMNDLDQRGLEQVGDVVWVGG